MCYFFPSECGELIPWCPEVVLYIIQPAYRQTSLVYLSNCLYGDNNHDSWSGKDSIITYGKPLPLPFLRGSASVYGRAVPAVLSSAWWRGAGTPSPGPSRVRPATRTTSTSPPSGSKSRRPSSRYQSLTSSSTRRRPWRVTGTGPARNNGAHLMKTMLPRWVEGLYVNWIDRQNSTFNALY